MRQKPDPQAAAPKSQNIGPMVPSFPPQGEDGSWEFPPITWHSAGGGTTVKGCYNVPTASVWLISCSPGAQGTLNWFLDFSQRELSQSLCERNKGLGLPSLSSLIIMVEVTTPPL